MNATQRANARLDKELRRQADILIPCASIVLWEEFGWRKVRIIRRFQTSIEVANECTEAGTSKSILQMLEDETGIELQLEGYDKSYHDLKFLDPTGWDGRPPTTKELLYIRARQKKWLPMLLLAGLMISLHRDEGFGYERLVRFMTGIDNLRREYGDDAKPYRRLLQERTGIDPKEIGI